MDRAADSMLQVVERSGPTSGRIHEFGYGELLIGRDPTAEIRIDHPDVSRRHARLHVDPQGVVIEDLGSKNGVFVGRERVTDPVRLLDGDSFSLGALVLELNHPASQVERALAEAGETTVTRVREPTTPPANRELGLLWPMLAALVFAGLLLAMVLL